MPHKLFLCNCWTTTAKHVIRQRDSLGKFERLPRTLFLGPHVLCNICYELRVEVIFVTYLCCIQCNADDNDDSDDNITAIKSLVIFYLTLIDVRLHTNTLVATLLEQVLE